MTLLLILFSASVLAGDWAAWRGPNHDGASEETGLVSTWSTEGENLLWRVDFVGRSTPVVLDGRVCVVGRVGEGVDKQEQVACFDAQSGKLLWEHRLNVFLTSVPFPRVGWASLAADLETGNIYFHGVGGLFICFDRNGKTLWERSLTEEFGRYSGYGGRTFTPVVDEDLVILGIVTSSWGDLVVPRHRYFAFDKLTGQVAWVATPGGAPADLNTYSTPVVAEIDGKRLLIAGNGDGGVYAMKVRTGEKVWGFNEIGELLLGKLSPEGYTDKGRVKVIEPVKISPNPRNGVNWAHPAFSGNKVYLRSDSRLVCLKIAGK